MTLAETARSIRRWSLVAIHAAGSGHPGGALSCADLLACLWKEELRGIADLPVDPARDRFVLSKGHACPALYAAAAEAGLIPHAQLRTLRRLGSPLQGHPCVRRLPWVETATGSLGQGFSFAVGLSLGLRMRGSAARVFVMLGDGELQEGQVWEAAMSAGHHGLSRLCAIVDHNGLQSDDWNERVMKLEPLAAKWSAFGWHVLEVDGHALGEIRDAFAQARRVEHAPTVILARTRKGRGVSYMEQSPLWHGSVALSDAQLCEALVELGVPEKELESWIGGPERG